MLSYLYQLQNATFDTLSVANPEVAVIDPDDSVLTAEQLAALQSDGDCYYAYASIGEAEDYRAYWLENDWDAHPPSFLLGENSFWEGNFAIEFWNPEWQQTTILRVLQMVQHGYDGVYLDVVDVYARPEVVEAYGDGTGEGQSGDLRQDMEDFVTTISEAAKLLNPDFKIIVQNAVELLALPDDVDMPNTDYLDVIDGVGKESTFYSNDEAAPWAPFDAALIEHATDAGKFVLAIDYVAEPYQQADFIRQASDAGYIPFIGERNLDNEGARINMIIPDILAASDYVSSANPSKFLSTGAVENQMAGTDEGDVIAGTQGHDSIMSGDGDDIVYSGAAGSLIDGKSGDDLLIGSQEADRLDGGAGSDTLIGGAGRDVLTGGEDADRFVMSHPDDTQRKASDLIRDFEVGTDVIDVTGLGYYGVTESAAEEGMLRVAYSEASNRTYIRDDYSEFDLALSGDYRGLIGNDDFEF